MEHTSITSILHKSLENAISYLEYRRLIAQLVENKSTSGPVKTQELANYTKLNDRRMKRWDKTIKVTDDVKKSLSNFNQNVTWLVLTESWCGDAAHVIPVLNKLAECSKNIDLKLVFRDENIALMDEFLTNGGRAVPKLLIIDNSTSNVIQTFGPRPSDATQLVTNYKMAHGVLTPQFKEDLQGWYNSNKGQNVISDVMGLLGL